MFDRSVPKPAYWKALVATLIFVVPIALLVKAVVRMPTLVWGLLLVFGALVISWTIYARMQNDWRAGDTMCLRDFERRTGFTRNVRIKRR